MPGQPVHQHGAPRGRQGLRESRALGRTTNEKVREGRQAPGNPALAKDVAARDQLVEQAGLIRLGVAGFALAFAAGLVGLPQGVQTEGATGGRPPGWQGLLAPALSRSASHGRT